MKKKKDRALRYNKGKTRIDLVPYCLVKGAAEVFEYGASKYKIGNWEKGDSWLTPWNSLMRHLWSWREGQDLDKESQLNHMKHVAANAAILLHYIENHPDLDNRKVESEEEVI